MAILPRGLSSDRPAPAASAGGRERAIQAGRDLSYRRERRGLRAASARSRPKTTMSDAAKNMLSNGDYANEFARESKRINSDMGMTKAQRKAQIGALKTRIGVEAGGLTGDAAEQALNLSRQSTRRGLTRSQRTGLASASETLLEASGIEGAEDTASDFEKSLLKFFDM